MLTVQRIAADVHMQTNQMAACTIVPVWVHLRTACTPLIASCQGVQAGLSAIKYPCCLRL